MTQSTTRPKVKHMTISHILLSCIFEAFHYGDMYDMPYAEWCKIQDCLAPVGLYLDEAEGASDRGPSSYYNPHNPV